MLSSFRRYVRPIDPSEEVEEEEEADEEEELYKTQTNGVSDGNVPLVFVNAEFVLPYTICVNVKGHIFIRNVLILSPINRQSSC